jgi:polysaccharide biosynthesis transport protein
MRRPSQQEIWELSNMTGLSNIIVGQGSLKNSVTESLVTLDVLTSGTTPPNPLVLLESLQMDSLIAEASTDYDFIIIDAPPLTAVSDGLILGKKADGMLLVVRPGIANTDSLDAAKNLLDQSGQRVLGMVVNGVTGQSSYGSYYASDYYGRYGRKTSSNLDNNKVKVM